MNLALQGSVSPVPVVDIRRYAISDRFEVRPPADSSWALQIWCPVIADAPYQRVLDVSVVAPQPWRMTRESEFGNVMFYGEYAGPVGAPLSFTLSYVIERLPIAGTLDPSRARSLQTTQLFARTLGMEQYVDVDERTRVLARHVAGDEMNPLSQARRIYATLPGRWATTAPNSRGRVARSTPWSVRLVTATISTPCLYPYAARSESRRALCSGKPSKLRFRVKRPATSAATIAGRSFLSPGSVGFRRTHRARASMTSTGCSAISN